MLLGLLGVVVPGGVWHYLLGRRAGDVCLGVAGVLVARVVFPFLTGGYGLSGAMVAPWWLHIPPKST
jgi:hypothetical protein